ncbi:TetR/AcrR family transcriptional regulator [Actinacidiphila acidipaludis]|uniref:TetR/AcrR family transcriptional regulator n=1 Tax=Actinacidiphila acidipaludis TaxID=2873382 RepID=A0ABS7QGE2_9ACTN|nr:TetR/AcrR family transcriptional regulator [Streptomyces acidipaludis]MBY8882018.1 TetR/AcrR family transcriptional regulator [Streptomyces acidipaludis]
MPKLWDETIDAHRRAVQDTVLETTVALVTEHGLASVTMSQIAKEAGIGRATLYKYFPDVQSILMAWHERHVAAHLGQLAQARDRAREPSAQLEAILRGYARITYKRPQDGEIAAFVHQGQQVVQAQQQLRDLVRDAIADAAAQGAVRGDVSPGELADYCLHALSAAGRLSSEQAVHRLVDVTLSGLQPSR